MKKVAFHTLGCKVNQVETEQLKEDFIRQGYKIVDFNELADVYVVNTCTVTHVSDRKSRAMLRRAHRLNPTAIVVAAGCLAQVNAQQLTSLEGVTLVVGNRDKENMVDLVEALPAGEVRFCVDPITPEDKLRPIIYSQRHQRTRAFVKIQDGCQSYCSYCIVPQARGPVRSKLAADVIAEINQLVALGYKEVVLTGIHTGFYGTDLPGWNLTRLLETILLSVKGDYRLRLSSLEPVEVNDQLLEVISDQRICRHFHIPLQSGSDRILQSMGRRYTREYYRNLLEKITQKIPGAALAADVMVGYPSEDESDFRDTYDLINELPFYDLHVFQYSLRPGTRAAAIRPIVPEAEKHRRSEVLLKLAHKKKSIFIEQSIGQDLILLVERKVGNNMYLGISDNYIEVLFPSETDCQGEFVKVTLAGADEDGQQGKGFLSP